MKIMLKKISYNCHNASLESHTKLKINFLITLVVFVGYRLHFLMSIFLVFTNIIFHGSLKKNYFGEKIFPHLSTK